MPFTKQGKETLTVGPLRIEVERGVMPPDEIRLWPDNPRTKHFLARFDSYPSEEDLVSAIVKVQPTNYRNLYKDIEKFEQQEPIFLKAASHDPPIDVATVIEGNTRVAILKDLHRTHPKDSRFSKVKAYLLPELFSDDDLAILMANYHVKGTLRNQWARYQIGAFLYEHIEQRRHFTQAELAEKIGKSASWVSRHLTVYKFAVEYKDEIEGGGASSAEAEEEVEKCFSILEEAWKVKAFRDEMDRDVAAKETLFRWVHEGKFRDHRSVRGIHELYTDPRRRQAVEDGDFGAGDTAANRLGKSIPLHEELDRILRRIEGVQIGDLDSIDLKRVGRVREALESLEAMLERFQGAS